MVTTMNLLKCKNGHLFDAEKFPSCPHCSNIKAGIKSQKLLGQNQHNVITSMPQAAISHSLLPDRKTAGWLVCISGTVFGESFCLREGENYIGRAANMDIALTNEPTVSRKTHAIIIYETDKRSFILYPQKSSQTFCNERAVKTKKTLKNYDVLAFGTCTFIFIAFCGKFFSWQDIKQSRQ